MDAESLSPELELAIKDFLDRAQHSPVLAIDASMVGPLPTISAAAAKADSKSKQTSPPEPGLLTQAGRKSAEVLRRLAPYGIQMAVSAAAYSAGLGLFQVLGYGLRVSCNTRFLSNCLGFVGVGFSSAFSAHLTRHVQKQMDNGGPAMLLRVPPWADVNMDEALLDAVVGVTFFKVCGGQFRAVMPSNVTEQGAWAKHSIPIPTSAETSGEYYAKKLERNMLERFMHENGCHHCGTRKGNLIGDHIPPTAIHKMSLEREKLINMTPSQKMWSQLREKFLGPHPGRIPQRLYPQCQDCCKVQAVVLRHDKRNPLVMHWRLWRLPHPGVMPGLIASLRPIHPPDVFGRPPQPGTPRPTATGAHRKANHTSKAHNEMSKAGWFWSSVAPSICGDGVVNHMRTGRHTNVSQGGGALGVGWPLQGVEEGLGREEEYGVEGEGHRGGGIWAGTKQMEEAEWPDMETAHAASQMMYAGSPQHRSSTTWAAWPTQATQQHRYGDGTCVVQAPVGGRTTTCTSMGGAGPRQSMAGRQLHFDGNTSNGGAAGMYSGNGGSYHDPIQGTDPYGWPYQQYHHQQQHHFSQHYAQHGGAESVRSSYAARKSHASLPPGVVAHPYNPPQQQPQQQHKYPQLHQQQQEQAAMALKRHRYADAEPQDQAATYPAYTEQNVQVAGGASTQHAWASMTYGESSHAHSSHSAHGIHSVQPHAHLQGAHGDQWRSAYAGMHGVMPVCTPAGGMSSRPFQPVQVPSHGAAAMTGSSGAAWRAGLDHALHSAAAVVVDAVTSPPASWPLVLHAS